MTNIGLIIDIYIIQKYISVHLRKLRFNAQPSYELEILKKVMKANTQSSKNFYIGVIIQT